MLGGGSVCGSPRPPTSLPLQVHGATGFLFTDDDVYPSVRVRGALDRAEEALSLRPARRSAEAPLRRADADEDDVGGRGEGGGGSASASSGMPQGTVLASLVRGRCRPHLFCPHCRSGFKSSRDLQAHLLAAESASCPPTTSACPHCPARFVEERLLSSHLTTERQFCERTGGDMGPGGYDAAVSAEAFAESHHAQCLPYLSCPRGCGGGFTALPVLEKHLDEFPARCPRRDFSCEICGRRFLKKGDVSKHMIDVERSEASL